MKMLQNSQIFRFEILLNIAWNLIVKELFIYLVNQTG